MKVTKYLYMLEFELGEKQKGVSGHLRYAENEAEAVKYVQELSKGVEKGKRFLGVRPLPTGFRTGVTGRLPNGDYHDDFYLPRIDSNKDEE